MTDPDFPVVPTSPPDFDLPGASDAAETRLGGEPQAGATNRPLYEQNAIWLDRGVEATAPAFIPGPGPPPNPLENGAVRAQIDEAPALATAVALPPPLTAPAQVGGVVAAVSGTFEDSFDPTDVPAMFDGAVDATPEEPQ